MHRFKAEKWGALRMSRHLGWSDVTRDGPRTSPCASVPHRDTRASGTRVISRPCGLCHSAPATLDSANSRPPTSRVSESTVRLLHKTLEFVQEHQLQLGLTRDCLTHCRVASRALEEDFLRAPLALALSLLLSPVPRADFVGSPSQKPKEVPSLLYPHPAYSCAASPHPVLASRPVLAGTR